MLKLRHLLFAACLAAFAPAAFAAVDPATVCPPNSGASSGVDPNASHVYHEINRTSYTNNVSIPNECLPPPPTAVPGTACVKIAECEGLSSNGGSASHRFMTRIRTVSGTPGGSFAASGGSAPLPASPAIPNSIVIGPGGTVITPPFVPIPPHTSSSGVAIPSSSSGSGTSSSTGSSGSLPPEAASSSSTSGGSEEASSSGGEEGGSSSSGPACESGTVPSIVSCGAGYSCSKDCSSGTPVCAVWEPGEEGCTCALYLTPTNCTCAPACTIQDPANYPECCTVESKPGYPCIKVCTLPNGDKVDVKEKDPSCEAFPNCCRAFGGPQETELGDPRDFCKIKCKDACDDWYHSDRPPPNTDFPECCTPPVPLTVACACCREAGKQPPSAYCEAFLHFFDCNAAECALTDGNQCTSTIAPSPEYDEDYDPYLKFDARYQYCSAPWANRQCRYICKGPGLIMPANAPPWPSIWSEQYALKDGILATSQQSSGKLYENNYTLQVFKNCTDDDTEVVPVPWPPPQGALPDCDTVF